MTDGRSDGRTDGRTDRQTDGQTDGRTDGRRTPPYEVPTFFRYLLDNIACLWDRNSNLQPGSTPEVSHLVVDGEAVLEPGDLGCGAPPGGALQRELAAAPRLQQLRRRRRDLHERLRLKIVEDENRVLI